MLQPFSESYNRNNLWGQTPNDIVMQALHGVTPDEIFRALSTDGSIGSSGSARIAQSLDRLVKILTQQPENFAPLLRRLETYNAKAISEEYVRLTSLGLGSGQFRAEGKLGRPDAGQYEAQQKSVKHIGQVGGVTQAYADASRAGFGDAKAEEVVVRTQSVLLGMDRDILWANDTLNGLAWEGLFQQALTDKTHMTDLAVKGTTGTGRETYVSGGKLTTAHCREQAAKMIKYGAPQTALYASPLDMHYLSAAEDDGVRYLEKDRRSFVAVGMRLSQILTDVMSGALDVVWNIHLSHERGKLNINPEDPGAPAKFHPDAPAVLATAPTGAVQAGGKLPVTASGFYYGVAAVSKEGEGPIKMQSTGYATTNANGQIELTITNPSDATEFAKVTSYMIYRSTNSGSDYKEMEILTEVAKAGVAGGTMTWTDDGTMIPGSRRAMQLDEKMHAMGMLRMLTIRDLPMNENVDEFTIDGSAVCHNYMPERTHTWKNMGGTAIQV